MAKREIQAIPFADVRKANNGPRMPKEIKARDVYCIDPGTRCAGLAWFHEGKLRAAGYLQPSNVSPIAERTRSLTEITQRRLESWWAGYTTSYKSARADCATAHLLIEFPEVYSRGEQKVNPRDLLWVSASGGAILGAFPPLGKVIDQNPKQWKAQLSKEAGNEIVLEALFPEELVVLKQQGKRWNDNNMLDAVGIGLQYLLRMRGA